MSVFEDFEREMGPGEDCVSVSNQAFQQYEGRLPAKLLELWREAGWCSYGSGLIWVVDPAQLSDLIEDWESGGDGQPFVFLRTSFGHLYFWRSGSVFSLDVQHHSLSEVTGDIELMFTLLCDPAIKDKILMEKLHEQAVSKLGRPARDECFAFEPALALGGTGALETIRRVKMREHLGILAQLSS